MLKTEDVTATVAWFEVKRGGLALQFLGGETPWPESPTLTGTISFYPESMYELHEQIRGEIEPAWGPGVREWGCWRWACRTRTGTS